MPWLEWQGEVIPCIPDGFENLHLTLQSPDTPTARQEWYLEVSLMIPNPEPAGEEQLPIGRDFNLQLSLPTQVSHWHNLGGVSIHACPAWHAGVARSTPYGRLRETTLEVTEFDFRNGERPLTSRYKCDRYHLRLGPNAGYRFPLELDAWLEPEKGFERLLSPEEAHSQPSTPPNFRILASPRFSGGSVEIETGHADPLETARRRLRRAIGLEEIVNPKIDWFARYERSHHKLDGDVPEADQRRCSVRFSTPEGGS